MRSTQEVLDHHLASFGSVNLEDTLADYTEESVLLTTVGAIRGLPAIREFYVVAYAEFGQAGTSFTMQQMLVDGECAFIAWNAETAINTYEGANDTFLVRGGSISIQTFGGKITPEDVA